MLLARFRDQQEYLLRSQKEPLHVRRERLRRLGAYDAVLLKLSFFSPRLHASEHQLVFVQESLRASVPDFNKKSSNSIRIIYYVQWCYNATCRVASRNIPCVQSCGQPIADRYLYISCSHLGSTMAVLIE